MRVLLFESDANVRAWLEAGLLARGHEVASCAGVRAAWKACLRSRAPLLVLDWAGTAGPELCRRLRALSDGERCVVLATGLSDRPMDLEAALEAGADTYLPKHADAGALEARIAVAERRVHQLEERARVEKDLRATLDVMQARSAETELRYRTLFEAARDTIVVASAQAKLTALNPAFETLTGWSRPEWIGRDFAQLVHPSDQKTAVAVFERVLKGERPHATELRLRTRAGEWRVAECSVVTQATEGSPAGVLVIARDITERKRTQQREATLQVASHVLGEAATPAEAAKRLLHALCVGLGWEVGILWTADGPTGRLRCESLWHLPNVDVTDLRSALETRLTTDEALASAALRRKEAAWVPDAAQFGLRAALVLPIVAEGDVMGVLELRSLDAREPDAALLRMAEEVGRQLGASMRRHQVRQELRKSDERGSLSMSAAGELGRALERDELRLHYQPIISLANGALVGFEALVRWQHPARGLVLPGELVPLAEETGYIVRIGDWVLREACGRLRAWQQRFSGRARLQVSVNLSGEQFADPGFADRVAAILREAGVDARSLRLEITESVILEHTATIGASLGKLSGLGVHLDIDDFGTGYSSLGYLHCLPVETLKLDRSFVALLGSGNDATIVRTILKLAHNLGMGVIAEGIETMAQATGLRALRCEHGQGEFFSKPLPPAAVEQMLDARQHAELAAATMRFKGGEPPRRSPAVVRLSSWRA